MPLVPMKDVLDAAAPQKTAVPAFNIDNLEILQSLLMAAEAEQLPVILSVGQGAIRIGRLKPLAAAVHQMASETSVPVVLHLDHGASFEQTIQCLRAGFTSVMYDGSRLPLEENIAVTRQVVAAAHAVGVSVEAELGAIGGVEDGSGGGSGGKVSVDQVSAFLDGVGVDALAVAIGNAHGLYKEKPHLDFDLLRSIEALPKAVPHLVLHGGSGLDEEAIDTAIDCGIRKINVATEIRLAYLKGTRAATSGDIYETIASAREAVVEIARQKLRQFARKA